MPDGPVVAGLVTLHGASDARARQPLFDQLAQALTPRGIAVLSFDRRAVASGDTPLDVQAADAVAAVAALTERLDRPVGLFGFSQGAWAATLAAADPAVRFLVVLGCSGVSPAEQMRYFTDEQLRRRGFTPHDRARNLELRGLLEARVRGDAVAPGDRLLARALRSASREAWFSSSGLPATPPPEGAVWADMDFDPVPTFAAVRAPVLALWGEDEECVPRQVSRQRWQDAGADVQLVDLPGCGHWPAEGSGRPDYAGWDDDPLADSFTTAVADWLDRLLSRRSPGGVRGGW